jgi:hypothetical protein
LTLHGLRGHADRRKDGYAERTVRAALSIQRARAELNLRIGIGGRLTPPGTKTAAGGIARPPPFHPQCDQRRTATTWCLPLPPQSGPESQPDPASEGDEHFGCFAEAQMADPAPHIRRQLIHCRLDADTLGPAATTITR